MKVAVVGTYPPRRCGIATFTADVESALREAEVDVMVVPVGPVDGQTHSVCIERDVSRSYERAAAALNRSGVDVVLVQHEFGIYGGDAGAMVLGLTEALTVPYVVTLHTVLKRFSRSQRRVVDELCGGAAAVTVFTSTGRRLLLDQGVIGARSLRVVPHGAPPELRAAYDGFRTRKRFGLPEDGQVLSTFGLLSSGKGIELAIEAVADLTSQLPNLHYVVAGRTHPDVLRSEGERYRSSLQATADRLGVRDRVTFVDEFLPVTDIGALLSVTDVFCTPYRGEEQTVSGALTYALAAACPVVSTPYQYARDVLADGAGELSPFDDPAAFAAAISRMAADGPHRRRALAAAELASMSLDWPAVGRTLASVLSAARQTRPPRRPSTPVARFELPIRSAAESHLRMLCDDTAMLQHADHRLPRLEDGYCIDDAGRALPLIADSVHDDASAKVLVVRLLSFIRAAIGPGGMRNFLSWDRRWLDEPHRGDHVGRAMWGLGEVVASESPFSDDALRLLLRLNDVEDVDGIVSSRELAYAALGLVAAEGSGEPMVAASLKRVHGRLASAPVVNDSTWCWSERSLRYDNARLAEVMIRVGVHVGDDALVATGAAQLRWYERRCWSGDHYRFPGALGVDHHGDLSASGDEQPLEAAALIDAMESLWTATGDPTALESIERCWDWFAGRNRAGNPVGDPISGAGYDGLGDHGVNENCGAESTIAFVRASRRVADVRQRARTEHRSLSAGS